VDAKAFTQASSNPKDCDQPFFDFFDLAVKILVVCFVGPADIPLAATDPLLLRSGNFSLNYIANNISGGFVGGYSFCHKPVR
jgi:hypothetical protein